MKLSDILEYVNANPNDKEHLLFYNSYGPRFMIVENLKCFDNKKSFSYRVKNPRKVNLEYIYYYLKLHMGLLNESDILNVEFIDNIILPSLPSKYAQDLVVPFIRNLYEIGILELDDKIGQLDTDICAKFDYICEKYDAVPSSELFKIKDKDMLLRNIQKGKFQDPVEDYIEILKPELLDGEYMAYYIHYANQLNIIDTMLTVLPSLSEQKSIAMHTMCEHNNLENLRSERRRNKLIIRRLIDEL